MKKFTQKNLLKVTTLVLLSSLALSACSAKTTHSESPNVMAENSGLSASDGDSSIQSDFWEIAEFEEWMEQQRSQNQKLADSKDKSFYYKDDKGNYVSREWTQEDVDSLYKSWQAQLDLMKEGYKFTKPIYLTDGGFLAGAFDPETWNAKSTSAPGATILSMPDGSTVDLGHFDTAEAAVKAAQEYLKQQVSMGKITQTEADNLLKNNSIE